MAENELHRLAADLRRSSDGAKDHAERVVRKAAMDIVGTAQQIVPVDTGYLRSTIGADVENTPDGASAEVGATARYARFVEEGTSRAAPQPYLAPALDAHEDGFTRAMRAIPGID